MHLELPIASFISAVLSLAPLPWHWRAGTVPTISISLWLFVSNIINGVNSAIWMNNTRETAIVWCDITTKIMMGANLALPVSIFCLCVHLERVSSVRQVSTDITQKRRRQYWDATLCFGAPMIYMALHYVVQGHRFDIIEDFGCRPATYVSVASIFLIWVPPIFFSLGAFILSGMAFRNFWIRRITFARDLHSKSALTPSRYFRLMAMSLIQMFWGTAIIAFNMWFTMRGGLRPWISWEDVHFNFSRIAVFPTVVIPPQALFYTYFLWWTIPISTFIFFAFFSFGQDAMKEYRMCCTWVRRVIFRRQEKEKLPSKSLGFSSIGLSSISKRTSSLPSSKSEITLANQSPPKYEGYQWNPPLSPSATTSTCFSPSSTTDVFNDCHKSKDIEFDAASLSSYCFTEHTHSMHHSAS